MVIDNDVRVFRRWQRLLGAEAALESASTFQQACFLTDHQRWSLCPYDCVLVEVSLPDGSGADLLDRLIELRPRPGVAVVTGHLDALTAIAVHGRCSIAVPKPADHEIVRAVIAMVTPEDRAGRTCADQPFREPILMNESCQSVDFCGRRVLLRRAEFSVLSQLILAAPTPVEQASIIRNSLGTSGHGGSARQQVYELRKKLRSIGLESAVETARGLRSYRWVGPKQSSKSV